MTEVDAKLVDMAKASLKDLKENFDSFSEQLGKVFKDLENEDILKNSVDPELIASMAVMAAVLRQFTRGLAS